MRGDLAPTPLTRFRLIAFDMDSTLINIECVDEIADAAGLSLGAAYHHFRSKEELLLAYYDWMQSEHERLAFAACPPDSDFRTRLATLLETKLALLAGDRKLLFSLFGDLGDATRPLSVFGKKTQSIR